MEQSTLNAAIGEVVAAAKAAEGPGKGTDELHEASADPEAAEEIDEDALAAARAAAAEKAAKESCRKSRKIEGSFGGFRAVVG